MHGFLNNIYTDNMEERGDGRIERMRGRKNREDERKEEYRQIVKTIHQ